MSVYILIKSLYTKWVQPLSQGHFGHSSSQTSLRDDQSQLCPGLLVVLVLLQSLFSASFCAGLVPDLNLMQLFMQIQSWFNSKFRSCLAKVWSCVVQIWLSVGVFNPGLNPCLVQVYSSCSPELDLVQSGSCRFWVLVQCRLSFGLLKLQSTSVTLCFFFSSQYVFGANPILLVIRYFHCCIRLCFVRPLFSSVSQSCV